jgi:hypothetical protein
MKPDLLPPHDRRRFQRLLADFAVVYPTNRVLDTRRGEMVRMGPLRLAFGRYVVDLWLEDPKRRTVMLEKVPEGVTWR